MTQDRYDEVRLGIFESAMEETIDDYQKEQLLVKLNEVVDNYQIGSITESEADSLMDMIEDKSNGCDMYTESDLDTSFITESEYDAMRLEIFNQCESGEITESVRDTLLARLNEKYELV